MIGIVKSQIELINGQTTGRENTTGRRQFATFTDDVNNVMMKLAYTHWANGEHEVQCVQAMGNYRLNTIIGRLRLTVEDWEDNLGKITLRKAEETQNLPFRARLVNASVDDLNALLEYMEDNGVMTDDWLIDAKWGTKLDVYSDSGIHNQQVVCLYPLDNMEIPMYWFYITRALPLIT
ncbi:MAG: hypothetical protein Salg2KO_04260 [Salibacteraceae bacterium]